MPIEQNDTKKDYKLPEAVRALAYAYATTPKAMHHLLDDDVILAIGTIGHRTAMLKDRPTIDVSTVTTDTITVVFEDAAKSLTSKDISGTVQQIGRELAEVIDRGMRRVLLEDKQANHRAYISLISLHAQVCKALSYLKLVD
jgi:hypothetical protein